LVFSKVFGASSVGRTGANAIALDANGAIYVAGIASEYFPVTPGAFRTTGTGFALKLSGDGSQLIYSTRIPGYQFANYGTSNIVVLNSGQLVVSGLYSDASVPTTSDSPYPCLKFGVSLPYFLIELNGDGSGLTYGTYLPDRVAVSAHGMVDRHCARSDFGQRATLRTRRTRNHMRCQCGHL
jgi:hypothetical protein